MRTIATCSLFALVHGVFPQTWEVFDMDNAGFPSNTITDIAIDSQDQVWAATDWGLCRFDGSTWSVFQTANSGLPDNEIYALAVDSLDRVWIGTEQHGLVIYDGSTWEEYNTLNSPLPDNEIKSIYIDHRGWAWIGTYLGLVCWTGPEWRLYNDTPSSYGGLELNGNVINDVAVRQDGLVAVATLNYGFHYLTDTSVVVHSPFIDLFPDNTQTGVAMDAVHDERWIATPTQGLLRQGGTWDSGPWFYYLTSNSTIASNALTCVVMDTLGRPWIGSTGSGIMVREDGGNFVNHHTGNSGLPDNTIMDLEFAHNGDLWIGTYYGGVARFGQGGSGMVPTNVAPNVRVVPNPCTDRTRILVPEHLRADVVRWELNDPSGRLLARGRMPQQGDWDMDLAGFETGTYLLSVRTAVGTAVTRIVHR